jgi:Protein of unknown function (DUF3486)
LGRRSSVYSLDEDLREELLAKWRSRRSSLDELVQIAKRKVSRAALHRFLRAGDAAFEKQLAMQRSAELWAEKLGDDPEGVIGRITERIMQTLANDQVQKLLVEGVNVDPKTIAILARALRDIEAALSMSKERELKIKQRIKEELADKLEKDGLERGIDAAVLQKVKELVRGRLDA